MRSHELMIVIQPEAIQTKVLMMDGPDQVLKAVLPRPASAHPRAASMLMEALALWYRRKLSVVLYADVWAEPFATGFCDGLGLGETHLHYEVDVVDPRPQEKGKQLSFTSGFSELEELCARRWP
jgi:hypothetical protein